MRFLVALLLVGLCWIVSGSSAIADAGISGAEIFEVHCVGCHVKGGNIVRRGKNLKQRTLERRGYDSIEAIAQLVANGKGLMSAYRDRLTPEEITAVSAYVLEQAENDWKS
ncbi:MAG: c-type cytochrome [Cyanobacteria bacterium J06638_20]